MAMTACDKQQAYQDKKQELVQHLNQLDKKDKVSLKKETSNLFRHRKQSQQQIDVRSFNQVISIDEKNQVAIVEGMTTYEALVNETLKHNLMPTVVPELKTITIGGALTGIGIESSSFRFGLVHETITEFDILLADGSVVTCTADNDYHDLFFAFPNSYGTLGYALRIVVKLIPVKPYVQLQHHHFNDPKIFINGLRALCESNHQQGEFNFIEGVAFDQKNFVITTASFVDNAKKTSNYTFLKIYFKSLLSKKTDYLSTHDYIWRWDTDWFWCSKVFLAQNKLVRLLLGRWLLKSATYSKIMRFAKRNKLIQWLSNRFETPKESVIQDVAIPATQAEDFITFFQSQIKIKPLWLCPVHRYNSNHEYPLFKMNNGLYINFGFWDMIPSDKPNGYYNRLVERKVDALKGNKSLYSSAFYTEHEFWSIYDKSYYMSLKQKYDPNNTYNTLFDKVTTSL